MPRQPKPFFRKQTQSWYFSTNGKQHPLGRDREKAFRKFHELMANPEQVGTENFTLYELSQRYLDWVKANRASSTYERNLHYLKSFIDAVGKRLKPSNLKPPVVRKWATSQPTWNSTSQSDAIGVVQRLLNWAVEEELLNLNPIRGLKKPSRKRRDVVYTPEQWEQIREHTTQPFLDFIDFLWSTGCRPKEARSLESRHLHEDMVIFPGDESKGELTRVLYLIPQAKKLLDRNMTETGPLFVNSQGNPWKKNSIKDRCRRISKKVGFRVIAYGARHSFATNALINEVDPISVAHLMGHRNPQMVSQVYSHLANNTAFLKQQAVRCVGRRIEPTSTESQR